MTAQPIPIVTHRLTGQYRNKVEVAVAAGLDLRGKNLARDLFKQDLNWRHTATVGNT